MIRGAHRGNILPATMAASALMALLSSVGYFWLSENEERYTTRMDLIPTAAVLTLGESFSTSVVIGADTPVNAFTGVITFDPAQLQVAKIDYNMSIADLWTEEPWYKNGNGTIHFAGGTTDRGGFTGEGTILTITFTSIGTGDAPVRITDAAVLHHDGRGTETALQPPANALFTVSNAPTAAVLTKQPATSVTVRSESVIGDVNGDGKVSIGDMSSFLTFLATGDSRGDVNGDGRVSVVDLSILVSQF
jgi:hypothetical protein